MPRRVADSTPRPPAPSTTPTLPSGVLRSGSSGEAVHQLQQALVKLNLLTAAQAQSGSGQFDSATAGALKRFQEQWRLNPDATYGPATRSAMVRALAGDKPPAAAPQQNTVTPSSSEPMRGLFGADRFNKTVALTFDDGPHPVNTPKVLDILEQYDVKATFFVTGENAQKYPELVRRIVAEGHTIGHHSWDHDDLRRTSPSQIRAELRRTQQAVGAALGRPYEIDQFRPPYGAMNDGVKQAVRDENDLAIMWNVDSLDWKFRNDDAKILQQVFEGSSSVYARGGVVLFHDIHPQTVRVLDDVIVRLKSEGFDIQKTDRLIGQKYQAPQS